MSCIENSKAYSLGSAATGSGTSVTIPVDAGEFNMITVMNTSNKDIKATYTTEDGGGFSFNIPMGFQHTRKMNSNLVNSSLKMVSLDVSSASGNIYINLGN